MCGRQTYPGARVTHDGALAQISTPFCVDGHCDVVLCGNGWSGMLLLMVIRDANLSISVAIFHRNIRSGNSTIVTVLVTVCE